MPSFDSGQGSTRIRHKEFVQVIYSGELSTGATKFNLESFRINPANAALFPWLSRIAQQFTEHRWHGLVMMYKPTSGESITSTNTALGRVIMATQYNVYEPSFINIQQMEGTQFAVSTKPSNGSIHGIECAKFKNVNTILYNDDSTANDDQRFEDVGKFNIATQGMQGQYTELGELWVSYDVELIKPRLIGTASLFDHIISQSPKDQAWVLDTNPLRIRASTTVPVPLMTSDNYKLTEVVNDYKTGFTPNSNFGTTIATSLTLNSAVPAPGGDLQQIFFPSWFFGKVKIDIYWVNETNAAGNNITTPNLYELTGSTGAVAIDQGISANLVVNGLSSGLSLRSLTAGEGVGYLGGWFEVSGGNAFVNIQNTAAIAANADDMEIPSCIVYITALPYNFD